ncbi:hypothetical protein COCSUDRAFT_61750 [Coccomyxa subellipsoidea C-169]|uniref:HTH HARE-type domain-containing protein n=1 Tax=Coccomyxa subellipsoidea (strain C-169) TaxID=574566 RepID=I0Z4H9_COCSC|nr:hypothetical protein COCSUDRAFT_61750 [Coccomyxa subellipsoidea C-169]EIE25548.1 hypothetical protein COCSUDRAFT_61750 [Coccomyxa subellipsoidea C-169]|eukprot:XP_005650092.1 hypothetical protein COCSUDRAFT_61750 [Coccomyxa subellipsoidea C-169]
MADPKTTLGQGVKMLKGGGGIFKSAAVAVLRLERKLMTTGDITKLALERQHIKCQGRTPEATMASALYTDVKRKGNKSVFTRPQEGLFGLREWEDEGFVPDPVPGIPPPSEIIERRPRSEGPRTVRRLHRYMPGRSPEDGDEEYSDLGDSPSRGASEDITDSPSPLFRAQNLHPLGVRYSGVKAGALQLLGDVCMTPLPINADFLEAAGSTEAKPPQLAKQQRGRPEPLSMDGAAGLASTLSSPLRMDKLAVFHDMVTSPEGVARLAAAASPSPDSGPSTRRKRPRLLLDVPALDSVDLEKVGSLTRASPATAALFAGFLPSAQVLPAPLYLSPPQLSALSPLPFATLHRPESAQRPLSVPSVLSTPNMISLAFAEADLFPEGDMQPSGLSPSGNSRGGPPAAGRPAPHTAIHPHRHTPVAHLPPLSPLTALLHGAAPGSIREGALRHDRPPPPLMLPISQEPGDRKAGGMVPSSSAVVKSEPKEQEYYREWLPNPPQQLQQHPPSPLGESSTPTTERLKRIEAKVQQMEANLGANHPQVGKAWLYLSKAYQNFGSKGNQAESFQCMRACSSLCTAFFDAYPAAAPALAAAPAAGDGDFAYLLGNMRSHMPPTTAGQQPQPHQQLRTTDKGRQA